MMNRVHPKAPAVESPKPTLCSTGDFQSSPPTTFTVWQKSLLFNCDGFTVFDSKGNLVFRVDKYAKLNNKGEIVLMDAAGNPLLTIRRKKLSLGEHWQIYDGEETANPRFSVRKHVSFLQPKSLAHVIPCDGGGALSYEVEGSYAQRCCTVYDERRRVMVEIRRKEAVGSVSFGLDVFRLVVQPGFDTALAMAIVISLEEMIGSRSFLLNV